MREFRIENHYYRWTVIDKHTVIDKNTGNKTEYALCESSVGDEAPLILIKADRSKITMKDFTNKKTGEVARLLFVPAELVIDDEVYDDIIVALEDNDLL